MNGMASINYYPEEDVKVRLWHENTGFFKSYNDERKISISQAEYIDYLHEMVDEGVECDEDDIRHGMSKLELLKHYWYISVNNMAPVELVGHIVTYH